MGVGHEALHERFNWVEKHTWPVLCNDSVDHAGLYTVKNKVANSGNEMAIREYGNQGLIYDEHLAGRWSQRKTYLRSELLLQRFIILRSVTRIDSLER